MLTSLPKLQFCSIILEMFYWKNAKHRSGYLNDSVGMHCCNMLWDVTVVKWFSNTALILNTVCVYQVSTISDYSPVNAQVNPVNVVVV